jgi:hypothetical protein
MATLLKVLNNLADIKSAGGVALRARTQDTFFAAHYMAELITTEMSSEIIKLKHYDWLRRGEASRTEIDLFTEVASDKFPSIRDAIMTGNRSMADFLKLLDRAEKFKSWLQATNPDEGLLNAYFDEATKDTWASKISTKIIKLALLNIAGLGIEVLMPTGVGIQHHRRSIRRGYLVMGSNRQGMEARAFYNRPLQEIR